MSKKTGGPAFPVPGLQQDEDFNGMTLRDYFAAKAMQSLILLPEYATNWPSDVAARDAYSFADAMLAERVA